MTPESVPIYLFTPYFAARTPERQRELDFCLTRNLACDDLARVFLLVDDGHPPPVQHPRLTVVAIPRRPTYADWLRLTRQQGLQGISLLANTDIHFDDTLGVARRSLGRPRAFLALSRYELLEGRISAHPKPEWSQDVWGLHTASELPDGLMKQLDIPLGVPRCDNKVAYLFAVHGWSLHNPQSLLRSIHVHETQQRNYDRTADLTVLGAVGYVHATHTAEAAARVDIDVWAVNTESLGTVSINRSLERWAQQRVQQDAGSDSGVRPGPDLASSGFAMPAGPAPAPVPSGPPAAAEPARSDPSPAQPSAHQTPAWLPFASQGHRRWNAGARFEWLEFGDECLAMDWLCPDRSLKAPRAALKDLADPATLLPWFVPPVFPTEPIEVADRPRHKHDLHFWQYPAATERQARDNHAGIAIGGNLDLAHRTVHTYLGLPWATYIDKESMPEADLHALGIRISGLAELARSLGWRLRVHTVCQHIFWRQIVSRFAACGITDLHLAHATDDLKAQREHGPFDIHSWPLIAPNIEDPARRSGLIIGKPLHERRYLASFIGAHMPHYRSDARLRLAEVARASGRGDVLVELNSLWHFNKVVYNEQVAGNTLAQTEQQAHDAATRRYNEVLSDSVFSLCPEGAGPNTLRVWESLAVGAIPVVVAPGWMPPAPRPGEVDLRDACVMLSGAELPGCLDQLAAMPLGDRERLMQAAMAVYASMRSRRCFGR